MTVSDYEISVFINCPFDEAYSQILDAIVFTIFDCGYIPRCALEVDNGTESRLNKIISLIKECRLGIHDLSRIDPDPVSQLPRFNMPFELGLFLGAKYYGGKTGAKKTCLILDKEKYRFQKFISDIAGHDISEHKGNYEFAIKETRNWLRKQTEKNNLLPSGEHIIQRFHDFHDAIPALCVLLNQSNQNMQFVDYCSLVAEWLKTNPL